jgi:GNAT superfamily N-acetyltransferase
LTLHAMVPPVSSPTMAIIDRAEPSDRAALLALLVSQFAEHDIELAPDQLARGVDGVLNDLSRGLFMVARADGRVVGVAYLSFMWSLEHGGASAWLDELYVLPSHRSRGIGRALLLATCDAALHLGCAAVDLEIAATHARAANLYLRLGFRPHHRTRWVKCLRSRVG